MAAEELGALEEEIEMLAVGDTEVAADTENVAYSHLEIAFPLVAVAFLIASCPELEPDYSMPDFELQRILQVPLAAAEGVWDDTAAQVVQERAVVGAALEIDKNSLAGWKNPVVVEAAAGQDIAAAAVASFGLEIAASWQPSELQRILELEPSRRTIEDSVAEYWVGVLAGNPLAHGGNRTQ